MALIRLWYADGGVLVLIYSGLYLFYRRFAIRCKIVCCIFGNLFGAIFLTVFNQINPLDLWGDPGEWLVLTFGVQRRCTFITSVKPAGLRYIGKAST
jgi:hypothetical protein